MTTPLGSPAVERVFKTGVGQADPFGNLTLPIGYCDNGLIWTGSITAVGTPVTSVLGATFIAFIAGYPAGQWYGAGTIFDLQVGSGELLTVQGFNVSPNAQVNANFIGRADYAPNAPITWPENY